MSSGLAELMAAFDSIGARLRAERKRLHLNQTKFGAIAGVTRQTISLYEKNERAPDAIFLAAIAAAGADTDYVLKNDKPAGDYPASEPPALYVIHDPTPSELDDLVKRYREAGPELRSAALRVLSPSKLPRDRGGSNT